MTARAERAGPSPHDVFISYSTHDTATADEVCAALEAHGIRCWIAPRDVPLGATWKASIVEAIRSAHAMVLVFSSRANDSTQVKREVDIAFESRPQIPIFVFRVENARMSDELVWCVGASQSLDALSPPLSQHTTRLAKALRVAGYASMPEAVASGDVATSTTATSTPATSAPVTDAVEAVDEVAVAVEPPRAGSRQRWVVLLTLGTLAAAAVIAFMRSHDRPATSTAAASHPASADTLRAPRPGAAPTVSPSAAVAAPPSAPPSHTGAKSDSGRVADPASATRPADSTPRAIERPARSDTALERAAPPESVTVQCAKLLERVSLGESLDSQEASWLRRFCRGRRP